MGTSLNHHSSSTRPTTSDREARPTTRDQNDNNFIVPSRTSSLHSRITQPIANTLTIKPNPRTPKTLTHAYMVCGVGREPSQWTRAPAPPQGKIGHMKGAIGQFWLPEILGSSPRIEQDHDVPRYLHAAMRACFPHDIEICTGRSQPHCVHHSFVLQQDSSQTLYGIALRVWSKADEKRGETIREFRRRIEPDFYDAPDEIYWIPYCLSFLSRYPLYNLLGDYIRGMWIHWNKATNLFHAEEVSRILSFPAPRLNDLVRIDMKDYALCYQFPSSPTGFQNFSMWPIFSCLSIPNIVGVIEAAVSATRRIILISHYPAILTVVAETIRQFVRVYEWSGLYVPVVHARRATELVLEPGPYILGVTAECRSVFTAPVDALVVDLDRNFVLTSCPPKSLTSGQRNKMIIRLTQALNGDVTPSGVPQHLRSAYGGGKLVPAGQIIVMRGEVESIQDPEWWNQDAIMSVMDHVCEKLGRNSGIKAVFGGSLKKPLQTRVSIRHLNEIMRERNQYSRDAAEAWQDFINLKSRMDVEITKVNKRNHFLVEELESWKQQFLKFQSFAEQLSKETLDLKTKIENLKRENNRLTGLIDQHEDEVARLNNRLSGTEKQRDDALEALVLQQEIAEELERERKRNKKELSALQHTNNSVQRQRDEAQRVVLHLRALISGQTHHMEHIVRTLGKSPELAESIENGYYDANDSEEYDEATGNVKKNLESDSSESRLTPTRKSPNAKSSDLTDVETRSRNLTRHSRRYSQTSIIDVADRHLKDKTDAIAHIIRNISEQCAAAVEGLQIAHEETGQRMGSQARNGRASNLSVISCDAGSGQESENGDEGPRTTNCGTSVPPTPDLVYNRSSTALSNTSAVTTPERSGHHNSLSEIPTRIAEDSDEEERNSGSETAIHVIPQKVKMINRTIGVRLSALGS
ncbi:BgTH12-05365 [Blumeria graminis f. sp. triticale]|uniref:Bgt-456 n=3 Tax=Blumeria graminis TaxID=34373 RepID=A0A9X9MHJ4_BLUGR|nr:hypothetical protein BGT96224_456 [Blumeria graminis f. sp. tritici 96224]CAD6502775.1 BgTH12-05365 [Blumeria graminis f. sp. triticale]VDB88250.1 Bgt-456 [Blumeria graminis f. sp. tritici]